jgi:hypothetical protein
MQNLTPTTTFLIGFAVGWCMAILNYLASAPELKEGEDGRKHTPDRD